MREREFLRQASPAWDSAHYIPPSPHRKRFHFDPDGKAVEILMKPHLLNSDEPLNSKTDHTALCGETVKNAEFQWDSDDARELFLRLPLRVCRKCLRVELDKRYIYVAVSGLDHAQTGGGQGPGRV